MSRLCKISSALLTFILLLLSLSQIDATDAFRPEPGSSVTLRISNWEEYIDEGGWADDEVIDLPSGDIHSTESMVDQFTEWYLETYGVTVNVQYATFGTNESLYNMLTLGDSFDLVCPSEYMFMKLLSEGMLTPLSDTFHDPSIPENYYAQGISPYIQTLFETQTINGEVWADYAAGYMWGVTGILYNPEEVSEVDASTWQILTNPKYHRQMTIKDNVRDSYFAALGALHHDTLMSESFREDAHYSKNLEDLMNQTDAKTVEMVQDYLQDVRTQTYAFETDSGKADMIAGRVLANYQWSGDAIYAMDEAEADDLILNFAVPEEVTNVYFDGWVMLEDGIQGDPSKQHAAEAFINFVSRPDNAIRNMYYIGYTSVISGGDAPEIRDYLEWNYGGEGPETVAYDVSYFFDGGEEGATILEVDPEEMGRQLTAQYPDETTMNRASIMRYFETDANQRINDMWVNVRCLNLHDMPLFAWVAIGLGLLALVLMTIKKLTQTLHLRRMS